MTKFEQIGIQRQLDADSKKEAMKAFRHSCDVCCNKGMHILCDKCAIAHVNREVIAAFEVTVYDKTALAKSKERT